MPGVSADATEAALVDWEVQPGAAVKRGDVLASIETEKAVVELEAEEDAVLYKTLVTPGELVAIGGPMAVFVQPGEEARGEAAILDSLGLGAGEAGAGHTEPALGPQSRGPLPPEDEERSQDALVPGAPQAEIAHTADNLAPLGAGGGRVDQGDARRVFASPLARRIAGGAGLRWQDLVGTGPGGRIRRRDVEAALEQRQAAPEVAAPQPPDATAAQAPAAAAASGTAAVVAGASSVPHSRFRRAVATALTASKQQVPHFYLKASCRVDALLDLRRQVNADGAVRITVNDLVVKAAAGAFVLVPEMNVAWTPDAVVQLDDVAVAVAVASERGLVTPVVRSAHSRSVSDISADIKDLAARAGAGALKQHELQGGSLTISNLGMFGIEEFTAIINPPQVGILAVGATTLRPVQLDDGSVGFGQFLTVVLSADHRPVDGALAARWLQAFRELLENPLRLLV